MARDNPAGEPSDTVRSRPRTPPTPGDLEAFRAHHRSTAAFGAGLHERRCRHTDHFDDGLSETVRVFQPVFAPWNVEILFLLHMQGALRFNALKRVLAGSGGRMSSRVLTDKLRHLQAHGFVGRSADPSKRAVTYRLTPRGRVVARHLHPLVFYLHNKQAVGPLEP